ncbi:MAG: MFS transporter [Phycisphaerae bacterium]|nr:MFS transporter [Phycisphaerae bacterium]
MDRTAPPASRRPLWNAGFISLLVTQFFEAASDNVLKGVLTFAVAANGPWSDRFGPGGQWIVGVAFAVPFIFLSAFGGRLADRYPKNRSTLVLKLASVGVALFTMFAFHADSHLLAMVALLGFCSVSSFFGPLKYGMIPELVDADEIGHANGVINMATNLAVISGTIIAGVVAMKFRLAREGVDEIYLWLPGLTMLVLVIGGLLACLPLPRLKAQNPHLPLDPNPFSTYGQALRGMAQGPLLVVALAWTFFYFLATVVLMILPDYQTVLTINETEVSWLTAIVGVAIGIGCVTAGWVSGKRLRPRLAPWGAFGLSLAFLLLGLVPAQYWLIAGLLFTMGMVAGFYIIPLQSMLQALSPDDQRGRFLGTANAMSFAMSVVASLMFLGLRQMSMPSERIFLVLAGMTASVGVLLAIWVRRRGAAIGATTIATLRDV